MVDWLKHLVIGEGNVIRERSYTNWNTFDDAAVVAEKQKEAAANGGDLASGNDQGQGAAADSKAGSGKQ